MCLSQHAGSIGDEGLGDLGGGGGGREEEAGKKKKEMP